MTAAEPLHRAVQALGSVQSRMAAAMERAAYWRDEYAGHGMEGVGAGCEQIRAAAEAIHNQAAALIGNVEDQARTAGTVTDETEPDTVVITLTPVHAELRTLGAHAMTTPTTDPFDAVNAFLREDFGTFDRVSAQVDSDRLAVAFSTAFFLAADRQFSAKTISDVIGFVARARQRYDDTGDKIDPRTGEVLIRAAAFDQEELIDGLDQGPLSRVQTVLLAAMVNEAGWNESELDAFVAEARSVVAAR